MKKHSAWIQVSVCVLALTTTGGCAMDTSPEDEPSKDIDEPAALDGMWTEVSPGVFLLDDGETRQWRVRGVEGHETFRAEIQQRLDEALPGEEQSFYQRVLDGLEGSIEYASQHPEETAYKGRVIEVSITNLVNGLRARAHASRGWGYVAAEVYVRVNDQVLTERKTKSDTCISGCSVTVQKDLTAPSPPTSCHAWARAQAGSESVFAERLTCPTTTTTCIDLTPTADAEVFSRPDQVNVNRGSAHTLTTAAWTYSGVPGVFRALLRFDLGQIPAGALISSATLSLFGCPACSPGHSSLSGSNEADLYLVTSPWQESAVTWNNQPSLSTPRVYIPQSTSTLQDYHLNITNAVIEARNNLAGIFGFAVKLRNEGYYRALMFQSRDYVADPAKRPKLRVCYTQ